MTNHIEIIAIGSEILRGRIVNSNASEISHALLLAGYPTERHTVLPDDAPSLKQGLTEALKRSRVVIATGGLGPTCDDITRQTAAELFHSDFRLDQNIAEALKRRYGSAIINLENQATVPTKAIILTNDIGTAPGLIFHTATSTLILMPGVPKEMRAMLHGQVIPYLEQHFPHSHYESKVLHFFELSEAAIDPCLRELQQQFPAIEFGIYPSHGSVAVQLTAEGKGTHTAALSAAAKVLSQRFAEHYLELPSGKIEQSVQQVFIDNKWTLALAESCTGGSIASRLTQVPGASQYFLGSLVCYSNALKESLLGVPKELLATYGAVSEQTVVAMVSGLLKAVDSDFGVAVSGVAGPTGGSEINPVGTVWIATARRGHPPQTRCLRAHGNREMVIERSVNAALYSLLRNTL